MSANVKPNTITIPPEAVEAAAIKLAEGRLPEYSWTDLDNEMRGMYREEARAAILAALEVWPGAWQQHITSPTLHRPYSIILPLNTENPDAEG